MGQMASEAVMFRELKMGDVPLTTQSRDSRLTIREKESLRESSQKPISQGLREVSRKQSPPPPAGEAEFRKAVSGSYQPRAIGRQPANSTAQSRTAVGW